jgi:hypothetical protein
MNKKAMQNIPANTMSCLLPMIRDNKNTKAKSATYLTPPNFIGFESINLPFVDTKKILYPAYERKIARLLHN